MLMVSILMLTFNVDAASAAAMFKNDVSSNEFDWNPVMEAIIQVESEGNPRAKSGNSVGVMQITPILVAECNKILKRKNSKKRYKLSDRYSISKSKEMFLLMQSVYNPLNSIEQAIRAWNGGNHYSVKRTQRYFEKVMKLLKNEMVYTIRLFQWSNRIFCFITCSFCNVYLRLLTLPNDPYFSAFSWVLIATSPFPLSSGSVLI